MSTKEERERDSKNRELILDQICDENQSAKEYIDILCEVWRTWDDIQDADYTVTRHQILDCFKHLFINLPTNTFFNENRDMLLSQHLSMYNAWIAANEWEQGDEIDQMYAHVWKNTLHELVPIVAFILKGRDQMEDTSSLIRKLFKSKLGE
tara:strand:- start:2899 stop:3351 length:453 start_codon:yes stop_codon:yes gene_type:complete